MTAVIAVVGIGLISCPLNHWSSGSRSPGCREQSAQAERPEKREGYQYIDSFFGPAATCDAWMLFSVLYMVLRVIFRLVPPGDERDREVEILVLRHQVKVLRRKAGRPKLRRLDRLLLAAAARVS
jgi:hypothetical protein